MQVQVQPEQEVMFHIFKCKKGLITVFRMRLSRHKL